MTFSAHTLGPAFPGKRHRAPMPFSERTRWKRFLALLTGRLAYHLAALGCNLDRDKWIADGNRFIPAQDQATLLYVIYNQSFITKGIPTLWRTDLSKVFTYSPCCVSIEHHFNIEGYEKRDMNTVRWELYPRVAHTELPRAWLQIQANLQRKPKTIDAYGRCLNDYLDFCVRQEVIPEAITREQVALYVQDLATRSHAKGATILSMSTGPGLSNSTLQQRLTVLRLFCDYLVEKRLRPDNPVGRGHYVTGKGFGGVRDRGLLPHYQKLPWLPDDEEWQRILKALKEERLRNQVMLLLAYDGALRREELVTLEIGDFDVAYRQIRVQAEHAKNGRERVVGYGKVTSRYLEAYLQWRRTLSAQKGPLFLSESHRNTAGPLSLVMWSKVVQGIAQRAGLPRFTTHTPRHLRLTHMARSKMELHQIATYAGHRSLETTVQ